MRKRFKLKKRSCPMCKPYKMRWETRWDAKEFDKLKRAEKEIRDAGTNQR